MSGKEAIVHTHWLSGDQALPPVQCVAVATRFNGEPKDWCAYIGASKDRWLVQRYGGKLPRAVAEVLFPQLAADFTWRD